MYTYMYNIRTYTCTSFIFNVYLMCYFKHKNRSLIDQGCFQQNFLHTLVITRDQIDLSYRLKTSCYVS